MMPAETRPAGNAPSVGQDTTSTCGFSLVEMIAAIMMLSIGILGMSSLMTTVSRSEIRATGRIEATEVLESKIEELRAVAAAGTSDTIQLVVGGSLTTPQANYADTASSGAGRAFVQLWVVEAGPGQTRKVTVRAEPRDEGLFDPPPVDVTTNLLINSR